MTYHHVVPRLEHPIEDWHVFTPSMRHVHRQLDQVPSVGFLCPLEKKAEELSQSFNKGLLSSTCEHDSSDSSDDDDFDAEQHLPYPFF